MPASNTQSAGQDGQAFAIQTSQSDPLGQAGVPVPGGAVWRVSQLPSYDANTVLLRLEADSVEARELLGDIDVWGHKPVRVIDRVRSTERHASGGFHTTGITLVLTR